MGNLHVTLLNGELAELGKSLGTFVAHTEQLSPRLVLCHLVSRPAKPELSGRREGWAATV